MSHLRSKTFQHYLLALAGTFAGAWLTDVTGSMLPLALGAAGALLKTLPLARALWSGTGSGGDGG